jgi:uncharacterized repeat protein (TIGR02543 family)
LTKEDVTSSAIEDSLEDTVEEAISETFDFSSGESCSITSEIGVEDVVTAKVGATATIENTRQWGTAAERRNSTSATHTVVNEKSQSFGQSISYTIGEHDEPEGHYRISIMATCDVYYLVTTSRDNSELISIQMLLCARDDTSYVLEYSENNRFNKTSTEKKLDLPDGFYKNYEIPTNVVHYKAILDVDGGYALDQTVFEPTMGQSYTLPVPTKYGYAFVGWYSAKNGEGTRYTDHHGNSCTPWDEYADTTLYACWISTQSKQITSVNQLKIGSQQIESPQSATFNLGFDIAKLKEIGFTALNISISGSCSGYDYKMNERGRYFVLRDAGLNTDLTSWQFQVKNFGGTGVQSVSLDSLDTNGHYTLRLISDRSDAYDEKLTVGGLIITITPVR